MKKWIAIGSVVLLCGFALLQSYPRRRPEHFVPSQPIQPGTAPEPETIEPAPTEAVQSEVLPGIIPAQETEQSFVQTLVETESLHTGPRLRYVALALLVLEVAALVLIVGDASLAWLAVGSGLALATCCYLYLVGRYELLGLEW